MLAQLAGEAATLTEAEVRAHFSAEFFAVWAEQRPPEAIIQALQQNVADLGRSPLSASPTHPGREALALVQSASGVRAVVAIGVSPTAARP